MSVRVEAGFERLKDALATALAETLEFPPGVFVTVLGAKVTANTAHARIVLSVFPDNRQADVLSILEAADRELKRALAERLRLRRIPRLHYAFDATEARAALVEDTLNRLKHASDIQL